MFVDSKLQRKKRLEQLFYQELSRVLPAVLQGEKGPLSTSRLTVMKVIASGDLKKINVFVHTEKVEAFNIIRQRASKIRALVAHSLNLRRTPEFHFLPFQDEIDFEALL
jgi:ribosome-binding factor A